MGGSLKGEAASNFRFAIANCRFEIENRKSEFGNWLLDAATHRGNSE